MDGILAVFRALAVATLPCVLAPGLAMAQANIDGVEGTTFNLTTGDGYITSADGGSIYIWGYALDGGAMQYPGPTLIVNEGDTVTVNLTNNLSRAVSIVFPGQEGVTASGTGGTLTSEAAPSGGAASYQFVASRPGTYMYHSGTEMDLQVEMGLVGALIVRPAGFNIASNRTAYGHPDSAYEHEYLFLLTEMDNSIHELVEQGNFAAVDTAAFHPTYWFINGRTAPDTLFAAGSGLFPHQPYNIVPRAHPGDRVLMRVIGAGRDRHPYHHHGNNSLEIARDGVLHESTLGAGADLSFSDYTIPVVPGGTYDAIFSWTGEGMGWDIYGSGPGYEHGTCGASDDQVNNRTGDPTPDGFHDQTWEYCADHGKPIPVSLPGLQDLTFGGFYSGSPYLGVSGSLPPGEGGLNANGGFYFMWHSHNEKEMINFDVFPGGMMTMFAVEPNGVPIP